MDERYEQMCMELIVNAGDGRSCAMEALGFARGSDYEHAREKLSQAEDALLAAHKAQISMIQQETMGQRTEVTLLLVHAQDHIMNAMTVLDLVREMVMMYQRMGGEQER